MKHYLIDMDDTLYLHRGKLDYDTIKEDRRLTYLCKQCPHPKYIYTNATFGHADILLKKMNLSDHFGKIYSRDDKIRISDTFIYSMKPDINSALSVEASINRKYKNEKNTFYFFDDLLVNLHTGKNRNWTTIWISPLFYESKRYPFVDYAYPNMKLALEYLNKSNS